jgi:hypothetical protein
VLPNAYHGIKGNYTANVLWVLNGRDAEWEGRLPNATRAYLDASRRVPVHPLGKFPLTETFRPDAPSELVTMLGQLTTHQMLKAAPIIKEMLASSGGGGERDAVAAASAAGPAGGGKPPRRPRHSAHAGGAGAAHAR